MKLNIFWIIALNIGLQVLTVKAESLKALEVEREIQMLVKVRLHGEPLKLFDDNDAAKTVAFSPDGKHIAVSFNPGSVVIYDIAAEKAKRFDHEMEKVRQEMKEAELNNLPQSIS